MGKFKPKTINLNGEGLEKVLGELESKVMDLLWARKSLTVRQVRDLLAEKHKDLSFNSIMTIMNRLVEKSLLVKFDSDGAYTYKPAMSKSDFEKSITKNIFTSLLKDPSFFGASGFAALASDLDKKTLDKLKKLIKDI